MLEATRNNRRCWLSSPFKLTCRQRAHLLIVVDLNINASPFGVLRYYRNVMVIDNMVGLGHSNTAMLSTMSCSA